MEEREGRCPTLLVISVGRCVGYRSPQARGSTPLIWLFPIVFVDGQSKSTEKIDNITTMLRKLMADTASK